MDILSAIGLLYTISVVFTAILIFLENRNTSKTVSWLLLLVFLPGIGFLMYLIFGENVRSKKYVQNRKIAAEFLNSSELQGVIQFDNLVDMQRQVMKICPMFQEDDQRVINLILNSGNLPVTVNNDVQLFCEGIAKFDSLLKDFENAKKHIHMEYFILKDSIIGNKIREMLIRKSREGVKVRIIYDDVGSWRLYMEQSYIKSLKDAGCEVRSYVLEKFPFIYRNINRRDHRKIVIIDGKIGYIGGINIGDEYVHQNPYFGFWRDTHLRIKGEAVYSLQITFLLAWYMMTGQKIEESFLFPSMSDIKKNGIVQIATSQASTPHETIYQAYFAGISGARKSIYIQTPYFIPDEALLTALKTALLAGVKVKIMFPSFPDHFIVYHASHSYLEEVMELGAEVYLYKKGFLHSKVVVIDRELATVGTANMDIRSFSLNAEINAFLYDDENVRKIYEMFEKDLKDCVCLNDKHYRKTIWKRVLEAFCRLFSPIL